jgi:hypothetical protein
MSRRFACVLMLAAGCGADDSGQRRGPAGSQMTSDAGLAHQDAGHTATAGDAAVESVCCTTSATPGCADHAVEQCVCKQVASCCEQPWDIVCVQLADSLNCAACKADCCAASSTKGCDNPSVEDCVCKGEASCCQSNWDAFCATLVEGLHCGSCSF